VSSEAEDFSESQFSQINVVLGTVVNDVLL
jgi:hypothetical protein